MVITGLLLNNHQGELLRGRKYDKKYNVRDLDILQLFFKLIFYLLNTIQSLNN